MWADDNILQSMLKAPDSGFETVYESMAHSNKESLRLLLIYLDKILNNLRTETSGSELRFSHVHFPEMDGNKKDVILEFIVLKYFFISLAEDNEPGTYLADLIAESERKTKQQVPEGFTAKSSAYKKWSADKKRLRHHIAQLKKIPQGKSFLPDTILNLPQNDLSVLESDWRVVQFQELDESTKSAYCLLNSDLDFTELSRAIQHSVLSRIKRVILFDCEYRNTFKTYNKTLIDSLRDQEYLINDLIILSFERHSFRLSRSITRLNALYNAYYKPQKQGTRFTRSYIFYEEEIVHIIADRSKSIPIRWLGEYSETLQDYLELIHEYGLDRLRSIGVMNIYAMALTDRIADLILDDLFSNKTTYDLFADEVRVLIKELDPQEKETLRNTLKSLLDIVVQIWHSHLTELNTIHENKKVNFIIPFQFANVRSFRSEWKYIFPKLKFKLHAWNAIRDEILGNDTTFILTYRDVGTRNMDLYPNIIESTVQSSLPIQALFFKMLFQNRYEYCNYKYLDSFNKLLACKFRYDHLQWRLVDEWIKSKKDHNKEILIEADDHEYGLSTGSKELIRVEYIGRDQHSFYPSKQLILQKGSTGHLRVIRADELPTDINGYRIQPLEDLHKDLNLFNITSEEEQELQLIKQKHNVKDQELWKVSLVRKLGSHISKIALYEEVKNAVADENFVRFDHFKNNWLDPDSTLLVPRKRKHFRLLCEYLDLPKAYYRLKLKKRASLTSNSRQSNSQMNALLTQMFNEDLFERDLDWKAVRLEHLLEEHDLEEKGITQENLNAELRALVDLLRDKIYLKEIQKLELA